ncbi:MAG: DUF6452 family protein [Bacteroidota bacterium]
MKPILTIITLALWILSCTTQEICDDSSESLLVARFKFREGELISDTIVTGLTLYGIREGKPDSLLHDSEPTSRIAVPLDPHHNFSRFVMSIDELRDTLYIGHSTGYYLMSYNCGYAAIFTLDPDSILHGNTLFHEVEIQDAVIDAQQEKDEEHLWIYF